jgi:transposase-like protein
MNQYSEQLRHSMAAKILMPGGPSAFSLARETGISQSALSMWARTYKRSGLEIMKNGERRPKEWSGQERFDAILATANLKNQELGEYLRKNGLTTSHLEKWKQDFISSVVPSKIGRPGKSLEVKALQKENKALKLDLHRKDKALAETSALLILKKKAQAIWGTPEDDE